jgi:hypothetical protein
LEQSEFNVGKNMKYTKAISCLIILLATTATAFAQQWSRYIPEKQRNDIYKKSAKVTGMGAALSHRMGIAIWVTEPVARAIVSEAVDRERLTPEEAEAKYRLLRPDDTYTFLIDARGFITTPFGAYKTDAPVRASEAFLQRADDRNSFSKGEVKQSDIAIHIRGIENESLYIVRYPKLNRSNEPLVKGGQDKMEIQFSLAGKKVVFTYKIKDLVERLEDL